MVRLVAEISEYVQWLEYDSVFLLIFLCIFSSLPHFSSECLASYSLCFPDKPNRS